MPFLLVEIKRGQLPTFDRRVIDTVNVVVLVAFAVDYFVELALAPDRRGIRPPRVDVSADCGDPSAGNRTPGYRAL